MKFGLSDEQYSILNALLIQPLKAKKAQVYVFGSRARGKFHPFSDIDVLFIEEKDFSISASDISKIKTDLENSNLAIKVDLVRNQDLAQSYIASANKDKILID